MTLPARPVALPHLLFPPPGGKEPDKTVLSILSNSLLPSYQPMYLDKFFDLAYTAEFPQCACPQVWYSWAVPGDDGIATSEPAAELQMVVVTSRRPRTGKLHRICILMACPYLVLKMTEYQPSVL